MEHQLQIVQCTEDTALLIVMITGGCGRKVGQKPICLPNENVVPLDLTCPDGVPSYLVPTDNLVKVSTNGLLSDRS